MEEPLRAETIELLQRPFVVAQESWTGYCNSRSSSRRDEFKRLGESVATDWGRWHVNVIAISKHVAERCIADAELFLRQWDEECELLLRHAISRHGAMFKAEWSVIEPHLKRGLAPEDLLYAQDLFDVYTTEVFSDSAIVRGLLDAAKAERQICKICASQYCALDTYPSSYAIFGGVPKYCNSCAFVVRDYAAIYDDDIEKRLAWLARNKEHRECSLCDSVYYFDSGYQARMVSPISKIYLGTRAEQTRPEHVEIHVGKGHWKHPKDFDEYSISVLYPNLFVNICPVCIVEACSRTRKSAKGMAAALAELCKVAPLLPTQKLEDVIWATRDPQVLRQLVVCLKECGSVKQYKEVFGSWFLALHSAGVLKGGTRPTSRGTHCLSEDGHFCHSLAERAIDDWLFRRGIPHEREPSYPGSGFRADWKVDVDGGRERIFIEYLGLTGNSDYDDKTQAKIALAREHGVHLIMIKPSDNAAYVLESRLIPLILELTPNPSSCAAP